MRLRKGSTPMTHQKGFTLIELLIVVAIIAILAAIAVPNFLEAQTRSKVSRAQSDMRSLATAIEAYQVDNNVYPPLVARNSPFLGVSTPGGVGINGPSLYNPGDPGVSSRFIWITTPISYMTTAPRDPFINPRVGTALHPVTETPQPVYDTYDYVDAFSVSPGGLLGGNRGASITSGAEWHIVSAGPDRINAFGGGYAGQNALFNQRGVDYDPTNGTMSEGDIVRIGSAPGPLPDPNTRRPAINRITGQYNF